MPAKFTIACQQYYLLTVEEDRYQALLNHLAF